MNPDGTAATTLRGFRVRWNNERREMQRRLCFPSRDPPVAASMGIPILRVRRPGIFRQAASASLNFFSLLPRAVRERNFSLIPAQ